MKKLQQFLHDLQAKIERKQNLLAIILIHNSIIVFFGMTFFLLTPVLFNYPYGFFGTLPTKYGVSGLLQYIFGIMIAILLGDFFLVRMLKNIDDWPEILKKEEPRRTEMLQQIREQCLNFPYLVYLIQMISPVAAFILVVILEYFIRITFTYETTIYVIKFTMALFSFSALISVIALIFSKNIFRKILLETYQGEIGEGFRIGLKSKIFMQILPILVVALLFTTLLGYSRVVDEREQTQLKYYREQLDQKLLKVSGNIDKDHMLSLLGSINFLEKDDCGFILTPDGKTFTTNGSELLASFIDFIEIISPYVNGRVIEHTGWGAQGVVRKIEESDRIWYVGVKYQVPISLEVFVFFLVSFIALLGLNIFVLYYFSKSLSDEISLVTQNLNEIASGKEVDLDKKLAVTSNDEIGDLVVAFNMIQEREKQHLKSIRDNQDILMERERLASLGQLIGGIAHNLRSPIMSLSGSIEALKDLITELKESVVDPIVTKEDYRDIAKEMEAWVEGMKPYCSYMSDLLAAVREQAVRLNASVYSSFTLEELIKRIEILINFELKRNNCTLDLDTQVDPNTELMGEVNNLVQVCNNLIINAIHSYDGKGGNIKFSISKDTENDRMVFSVRDYGKGIPEEIQACLFKEMVTTKGNKGTGLGLYMSYLNIKGRFAGDIWFQSREGKGTIFYISIPCNHTIVS